VKLLREILIIDVEVFNFYQSQIIKVQKKIDFVFDLVRYTETVPSQYFKYLKDSDGIFEIRVITYLFSIRFLGFLDGAIFFILTNHFIKKTDKTPKKMIELAEKRKKQFQRKKQ
jgi:phage-related protein